MPIAYYLFLILLIFSSSCATSQKVSEPPAIEKMEHKAISPPEAKKEEISIGAVKEKTPPIEIPKSPTFERTPPQKAAPVREPNDPQRLTTTKEPVMINVEKMPLSDFIIHALGETLKVPFVMDQKVMDRKDPVTIRMTTPLPPAEALGMVLGLFEKHNLYAEIMGNSLYILSKAPDSKPPVDIQVGEAVREGAAVILQVVPLRYIRTADFEPLLREFYKSGVQLRSYPRENILLLSGQASQVKQMMEFIQTFDVPYLQEKKTTLLKLTYWQIDDFIKQISQILEGVGFSIAKTPKDPGIFFVPLKPLGSVLVVSPDEKTLDYLLQWKEKLDTPEAAGTEERPFVYTPKYTKASDLVTSVKNLYGVMPPPAALREPVTPTAPARPGAQAPSASPTRTSIAPAAAGGLKISSDDQKNIIMVLTSPAEYRNILNLLNELDVPPRQVLIEATVAELTLTGDLKLGLQWFYRNSMFKGRSAATTIFGVPATGPGLVYNFLTDSGNFNLLFNALADENKVNILSTPRLMVLDNQEATIQIGTDVPIITGEVTSPDISGGTTAPSVLRNFQYRSTGVILRVKPTINTEGLLTLNISQEVSEVGSNPPGIDSPTILTRRVNTNVVAAHGETIVLGGLISENKSAGVSKVPILGDIPLLGYLFKSTTKSVNRTELIVFLKPAIITKIDQASKIAADLMREMKWMKEMKWLEERQ